MSHNEVHFTNEGQVKLDQFTFPSAQGKYQPKSHWFD